MVALADELHFAVVGNASEPVDGVTGDVSAVTLNRQGTEDLGIKNSERFLQQGLAQT